MIHLPLCSADVSVHTRVLVLVLICTPFNKLLKIKLFSQKLTRTRTCISSVSIWSCTKYIVHYYEAN